MNPKLQEAGRRGGRVTGQSKVRPLTSDRAKRMAQARWQNKPQPKTPDGKCYLCAICNGAFEQFEQPLFLEGDKVVHARCPNVKSGVLSPQDAKTNAANGPTSDSDEVGAV